MIMVLMDSAFLELQLSPSLSWSLAGESPTAFEKEEYEEDCWRRRQGQGRRRGPSGRPPSPPAQGGGLASLGRSQTGSSPPPPYLSFQAASTSSSFQGMTCFHQILCATGHIVQIQVLVHNHFHFLTKCMSLDCVLACSWGSSGPRVDLDLQLWWHSGCAEYLHPFYFSVFVVFQQCIF